EEGRRGGGGDREERGDPGRVLRRGTGGRPLRRRRGGRGPGHADDRVSPPPDDAQRPARARAQHLPGAARCPVAAVGSAGAVTAPTYATWGARVVAAVLDNAILAGVTWAAVGTGIAQPTLMPGLA